MTTSHFVNGIDCCCIIRQNFDNSELLKSKQRDWSPNKMALISKTFMLFCCSSSEKFPFVLEVPKTAPQPVKFWIAFI